MLYICNCSNAFKIEMEITDKPKVIVKVKNMSLVLDYCIENKLKFSASPRLTPDEWEFELGISDIMGAVALGMFLRENRLEAVGLQPSAPKAQVAARAAKVAKAPSKKETTIDLTSPELEETPFAVSGPAEPETPAQAEASDNDFNEFASDSGSHSNDLLFGSN